jgi:hypothetical protein
MESEVYMPSVWLVYCFGVILFTNDRIYFIQMILLGQSSFVNFRAWQTTAVEHYLLGCNPT